MTTEYEREMEFEDAQREALVCAGCGDPKSKGLAVCWDCFKYRKNPFKTSTLSLEKWLNKYGVKA